MIPSLNLALSDRYRVLRELGRGGMATVYLAEDLRLHRQVALKVLRPDLAATLGNERFLREIEIAARLSHPHILQLHDSGEAEGHIYYAMPYVEGESLRQRLEREGQLPIPEVITIVRAVASALTYAHHHRVIHRDIKPENILLGRNSEGGAAHPLVADFGIARALDAAGGERLTETGLALGTPAYMSPEQSAADHRLDGRSDIYSLGCVAYEMLAGQPPFTGPTAQAILARHAVDPVPPLHTVRATIPPAVEAAIEQALAKVPADRFSTADEFAHALTAEHVRMPLRRKLTSRRAKVALVMAAAAAAAGLGATLLGKSPSRVVPSAATMAILPFFAGGTDTALSRLGRDLAVTLSASLDGIGGIETADRLTVANATADRNSLSPAEGATLARRLGSSSFLRGTLVRAGDNVRLDLGLYSTAGLAPLAEGITVTAHRDSIGTLTDSASWALLRQVWQRGEPPSPSLADITSRSLPALRSFLEGERQLGANEWNKAALAFKSAIAVDSGFALAHFRYALTQWWTQQQPGPDVLRVLRAQRQALSERERMLVDAFLTSHRSPKLQIERYQAAAERFPDYWPAWFLYADALFHQGPTVGHDRSRGLEAFRRVLALNPKLVPGWEHLFDLTLAWDKAEASAVYAKLVELGWLESQPPGGRLVSRLLASVAGLETNDRLNRDQLMDSLANFMCCGTRAVPSQADFLAVEFEPLFLLQAGFPAAQLELNHRALRSGRMTDRVTVALQVANAWAWAARGRWDSATVLISRVATVHPGPLQGRRPVLAVESYGLAVLGAWLGATSPDSADARRPAALGVLSRLAEENHKQEVRGRVAWFDGLLAHARGDRRAIHAARRAALESGDYQADRIERSLAAFERALAGDRKGAGHALELLNETCLEDCNSFTPYDGVQHFAAAQWLGESGDSERAAKLLRWPDRDWQGWLWTIDDALAGPGFLARARIEESRGQDSLAVEYYRQFLRRYDQPMPSQAHLVEEAKAALARLQNER